MIYCIFSQSQTDIFCFSTLAQRLHEGSKYACYQCDHQATTQSSLTRHIQVVYEGIKYACSQCKQQFTQPSRLSRTVDIILSKTEYSMLFIFHDSLGPNLARNCEATVRSPYIIAPDCFGPDLERNKEAQSGVP